MKVFILGSCVSRDAIEAAPVGEITLVDYIARTSIGSIFSARPFADNFSEKLASAFQRRLVNLDITKSSKNLLSKIDGDIILLDLIDERFDLLEVQPGHVCTMSNELVSTGAPGTFVESTIVRTGSVEFIQYWTKGWAALVQLLAENGLLHKLRVNAVEWQMHTMTGAPFKGASLATIQATNEMLSSMYSRMADDLEPHQFFRYGKEMVCPDDHKWAPEPFHFGAEFCQSTLQKLRMAMAEISTAQ